MQRRALEATHRQTSLAVSTRVSGSAVVAPYEKNGRAGQRLTCLFAYSCNRARQTMMVKFIIPAGFSSGDQQPGDVVSFGSWTATADTEFFPSGNNIRTVSRQPLFFSPSNNGS